MAVTFPSFWAMELIFSARGIPTSVTLREKWLRMMFSSFLDSNSRLFASCGLRMVSTTLIVKSISTLSILFKALNHTPERNALTLRLTNLLQFKEWKELWLPSISILCSLYISFEMKLLVFMNSLFWDRFVKIPLGINSWIWKYFWPLGLCLCRKVDVLLLDNSAAPRLKFRFFSQGSYW